MAELMSDIDVEKSLKGLDGWSHDDVRFRLQKEFDFNSFESAVTPVSYTHMTLPTKA